MKTFTDVACTVCGCVCDDLALTFDGDQLLRAERACPLAEPWFAALSGAQPPMALIRGNVAELAEAVDFAAQLLKNSDAPLIYGLSRSSTPGQRAAVRLAERLGGVIDTTASVCHGPSIVAIQSVGESTCSLGEVRQRADLVVFWGADPVESHPRHFERYSVDPASEFLPNGRGDRTIIVVDDAPSATTACADLFLQVAPDRDFELIWALRELLRDPGAALPADCGLSGDEMRDLAERMRSCRYGAVFFGLKIAQSRLGHLMVEALLRLVDDLNAYTRFTARRLRIPGDVSGADSVLCWQTGFPFGVDFSRGSPRYNPGEFTANDLLERGDVDCALIVGSESVGAFSPGARARLAAIPTIVLDSPHVPPAFPATVQFTTAVYGIHAAGTAYRMDEVPIPLRKLIDTHYPTDEEILNRLRLGACGDEFRAGTARQ